MYKRNIDPRLAQWLVTLASDRKGGGSNPTLGSLSELLTTELLRVPAASPEVGNLAAAQRVAYPTPGSWIRPTNH